MRMVRQGVQRSGGNPPRKSIHGRVRVDGMCDAFNEAMDALLQRFGLTLMVNHACNLRCNYCYTGAKFSAPMKAEIGTAAIERALRSLRPGGRLDLSFFGGEPLLESARILGWMAHAQARARQ